MEQTKIATNIFSKFLKQTNQRVKCFVKWLCKYQRNVYLKYYGLA